MALTTPKTAKVIDINSIEKSQRLEPVFPDWTNTEKSRPANSRTNLKALTDFMGVTLGFNLLTFEPSKLNKKGEELPGSFDRLRSDLIGNASIHGLQKVIVDDHALALSEVNPYHPIKHILDSVVWDGSPRMQKVIDCLNAKDKELANLVMRKWLVGCVASLYEHKFSSKLVPILQGGQSFRKTAFISRIASITDYSFLEGAEINPDNKDSVLSCIRSWIVELGELERTSKNSQGALKAFITKSVDTVRPPYARTDIKKHRQTSLIGTVNGSDFLNDETGSSRYAVLEMERQADVDAINILLGWTWDNGRINLTDKNQLNQFWAEVKSLYDQGESWLLDDHEAKKTQAVNGHFDNKGNWYQLIEEQLVNSGYAPVWQKSSDICTVLEIQTQHVRMVGKALKRLHEDGKIDSRKCRGRTMEYYLPNKNLYFPDTGYKPDDF